MAAKEAVTLYLPEKTKKLALRLAKEQGLSLSSLVGMALNMYVTELSYHPNK